MRNKPKNEDMYRLYDEYKNTLKKSNKPLRKRQKINTKLREKYGNPYHRNDYNSNKNDITNWNSMIKDLEEDLKSIEMYLDYDDRHYLHKECDDFRSMIYNQNSYEGGIPFETLYGESIPDTTNIISNVELQEEIVELLDDVLTERQKQVIQMYFWNEMTQEKIGKELGIKQQSVQEFIKESLEKLRNSNDISGYIANLT